MPCDDGVCFDTASGVRLGVNGANVCRPCGNTGRPQCQSAPPLRLRAARPLLAAALFAALFATSVAPVKFGHRYTARPVLGLASAHGGGSRLTWSLLRPQVTPSARPHSRQATTAMVTRSAATHAHLLGPMLQVTPSARRHSRQATTAMATRSAAAPLTPTATRAVTLVVRTHVYHPHACICVRRDACKHVGTCRSL